MKKTYSIISIIFIACAAYAQAGKITQDSEWLKGGKKIRYRELPDSHTCYLTVTDEVTNHIDTVFTRVIKPPLFLNIWEAFVDTTSKSLVIYYREFFLDFFSFKVAVYGYQPDNKKYFFLKEEQIDYWKNGYLKNIEHNIGLRQLDSTTFEYRRKNSKKYHPDRSLYDLTKRIQIDYKTGGVHMETADLNKVCFEKHIDMSRIEHRCSFADTPNYLFVTQLQLNRVDTVFYTRENGHRQGLTSSPWYIADAFMDKETKGLVLFYNKFSDGMQYLQLALFQLRKDKKRYELVREVNVETWPEAVDPVRPEPWPNNYEVKLMEDNGSYTYTRTNTYVTIDREPPTNVKKQIYIDFVKHQIAIENKTK
jgi:hypothetical protein